MCSSIRVYYLIMIYLLIMIYFFNCLKSSRLFLAVIGPFFYLEHGHFRHEIGFSAQKRLGNWQNNAQCLVGIIIPRSNCIDVYHPSRAEWAYSFLFTSFVFQPPKSQRKISLCYNSKTRGHDRSLVLIITEEKTCTFHAKISISHFKTVFMFSEWAKNIASRQLKFDA